MEITKVDINNGKLYEIFMKDEPDGEPTRLAYYIEEMESDQTFQFGGNTDAVYHVMLEGKAEYIKDSNEAVSVLAGETFYCENENSMKVTGEGRLLSMLMEKSIRGAVRTIDLENEKVLKIGEVIGESCVAFCGLDGAFLLECEQGSFECKKNQLICIHMNRKEFSKIRLLSEKAVQVVMMTGVKMFDSDFSRVIGVYILEQGYGHCKVRMDIKKEHMNPIGSVHGGALFTMADEACGIAASTTGGVCTTVDSHIEFLNAAIGVKYLTAEAKPKKIGKKIRSFVVEIKDEKERLIATADFIFFCLQN